MKYCTHPAERHGSCYHEFYRGKWDEVSCWKADSLLLHDDVLFLATDFVNAVRAVFPDYDSFGETEVSAEKWRSIGQYIPKNSDAQAIYEEIDKWATDVFDSADCFTTPVSKIYATLRESKSRDFKRLRRLEAFLPSSGRPAKEAKNTSRRMERPNVKRVC